MLPPMEDVTSARISQRGHDAANNRMFVRFQPNTKNPIGALYSYENISPELYAQGLAYINPLNDRPSFGGWFEKFIKPNVVAFPFLRIEEAANQAPAPDLKAALEGSIADTPTVDFASGAPVSATTPEDPLPEDPHILRELMVKIIDRAKNIVINTPEAYAFAEATASKIARLRDAWKKICAPDIEAAHQAHKAALAIYNNYEKPLAEDQARLTGGMLAFKRQDDARRAREAQLLREAEQRRLDAESAKAAAQLHEADTLEAIDRGEIDVAETMIVSAPLPLTPAFVPPVHVPSAIQNTGKSYARDKWSWEYVDRDGKPSETPDLSLIPTMYLMVNEAAIGAVVKNSKNLTSIPGIRAYNEGGLSIRKK